MFGSLGEKLSLTIIPDHPGFLLAILPPGAFIGLGLLIAARNWWQARRQKKAEPAHSSKLQTAA